MASALESALDALYLVAPEQFIETRKALAAQLGKGPDAKAVLEQKKPTRVAHVLNRLARDQADDIAGLSKIAERLSHAHQTGKADALREVISEQRQAVTALSTKASALMSELGVGLNELPAINAVLQAATTSPERAAELALGRFSKTPEANVSFFGGVDVSSVRTEAPEVAKAESKPVPGPAAKEDREAAMATARKKWEQARESAGEVERLEAEHKRLEREADEAAAAAQKAKSQLHEARMEAKRHATFATALKAEHQRLEREEP